MTGQLWPSAMAAALFAVHPLRVESVAWVTERKDVLSGLFFTLIIGVYVWYARRPFSLRRYLLLAAIFMLGLMAKLTLMTLPVVFLLLDYWPLKRFAGSARQSGRPHGNGEAFSDGAQTFGNGYAGDSRFDWSWKSCRCWPR